MVGKEKIADLLIEKFVSEEIMTKSEFQLSIDRIMDRHEARIDVKFQVFDNKLQDIRSDMRSMEERVDNKFQSMEVHFDRQFLKIDGRYNWIIGSVITAAIGIISVGLRIVSMIPH